MTLHSRIAPPWVITIAAMLALGIASCATAPPLTKRAALDQRSACSDASSLAWYIAIDPRHLRRCSRRNRIAAALLRVLDHDPGGADALVSAATDMADPALRRRAVQIAVAQMENAYRFRDAADAADRSGQADVLDAFTRAYARFAAPSAEIPEPVIEIAYDNLRVPAMVDGMAVTIALDTGAPGIGIDPDLAKRLGYVPDRSVSRMSNVPAFKLSFPVFPVMLAELRIGSATFRNLPANVGEVPPDQAAALRQMQGSLPAFDIIMGLDAFANFLDVVEFDFNKKKLRLIRDDHTRKAAANYILGSGAKPVVRLGSSSPTNVYLDTGAYGHLLGPDGVGVHDCIAVRRFQRPWGMFEEYRIRVQLAGNDPIEIWASRRAFGGDPAFDVTGVFGIPRSGVLRVDMEDRAVSIARYDVAAVNYDYQPTEVVPIGKGQRCY